MKPFLIALALLPIALRGLGQDFDTKEWNAATHDKPLIFYLTGDGGFNKFSLALCQGFNAKGYDVAALNCRSYFWDKKTPAEAADAVRTFLDQKLHLRANQQVAIIGYSFGADVLPFILNQLDAGLKSRIPAVFLMASSGSTDFEIHWSDILGGHSKRERDVATELNKVTGEKVVILNASDDKDLDLKRITIPYRSEVLPGGHHFDGNTDEIIRVILKDLF